MIFKGMWYSTKKLEPSIFLEPLYRELKILEKFVNVIVPLDGIGLVQKVIRQLWLLVHLIYQVVVWFLFGFSECHGCIKCYQEGKAIKLLKVTMFGYTHIKFPTPKVHLGHMKTHKKYALAFKEDKLVYGVKYSTCLHRLKYSDLVDSATCMELC